MEEREEWKKRVEKISNLSHLVFYDSLPYAVEYRLAGSCYCIRIHRGRKAIWYRYNDLSDQLTFAFPIAFTEVFEDPALTDEVRDFLVFNVDLFRNEI